MAVAKTKAVVKRCKNLTLEPKDLSFEELQQMTNDFSHSQEISRGELGVVYKDLTGTHATKLFRGFVRLYIIFMRDRKNLFIIWT